MNQIICHCFDVTKKAIIEAIKKGAKTVEDITQATYAGGGCQRCREQIQKILDEETK